MLDCFLGLGSFFKRFYTVVGINTLGCTFTMYGCDMNTTGGLNVHKDCGDSYFGTCFHYCCWDSYCGLIFH